MLGRISNESMTIDKTKLKKTLAREILFFFAGVGIIGIIWSFLLIRNSYYENKASTCSEKAESLQAKIDSLPKDYIKAFYEKANRYFVVIYRLGQDYYAIPKEQEEVFLHDEFEIRKNVMALPGYPKGYSYFEYSDPLDILGNDSTLVFDYVTIEKFRELASSEDYQDKLYSVFANFPGKAEWVPPLEAVPVDFDPKKPYHGLFQLGTLSDFKAKMKMGLSFDSTVVVEKTKIESEISNLKETITSSNNLKLNTSQVHQYILHSALVIGLLIYVLRLSIFLIVWSLKTIKQNNGQ